MSILNWLSQAKVIAWLVRLAGLSALFGVLFKRLPGPIEHWLPFGPASISHFAAIVLGFGLIYIAGQLARKKYNAFLIAAGALAVLIGFEIGHHRNVLQILLYITVLGVLLKNRQQYVVKSDYTSTRRIVFVSLVMLSAVIAVASAAFFIIDQREFGIHITTFQSLSITVDSLLGKPIPAYLQADREGVFLIDLLRFLFFIAIGIIVFGIFRPIQLRGRSSGITVSQAEALLRTYSVSSEDFFKLWPPEHKHYFFYKDTFVAYGVKNGIALILDGCSGNPTHFSELRKAFYDEAQLNGWEVAVLHADQNEVDSWRKIGSESIYIGSEARVDIAAFQQIIRNKHFRYVTNKANKENLRVAFWSKELSQEQLGTLKEISDAWLQNGDRREYQFAMGYFAPAYLKACDCAVLYQNDKAVAYINFIPSYYEGHLSIDHMRFIHGLPNIAMHYLFLETLAHLHTQGAKTLNLGLAPLSKLEENASTIPERLLGMIKRLGGRYYSFNGLEQFKSKFDPGWEARYIIYFGSVSKLIPIGIALNAIMTRKTSTTTKNYSIFLMVCAVIAAVGYAAWPLAIVLNPAHAFSGLVSLLSANAQPYDWVFNWLDYISSIITISLFGFLFVRYKYKLPQKLRYATFLIAVSGAANLLAALVDLPNGFAETTHISISMLSDPTLVIHGLASFVNTITYVAAVILWYKATAKTIGSARGVLLVSMLLLATVGYVVGQLYIDAGYGIQRAQIILYAVWLVWFTKDIILYTQGKLKETT